MSRGTPNLVRIMHSSIGGYRRAPSPPRTDGRGGTSPAHRHCVRFPSAFWGVISLLTTRNDFAASNANANACENAACETSTSTYIYIRINVAVNKDDAMGRNWRRAVRFGVRPESKSTRQPTRRTRWILRLRRRHLLNSQSLRRSSVIGGASKSCRYENRASAIAIGASSREESAPASLLEPLSSCTLPAAAACAPDPSLTQGSSTSVVGIEEYYERRTISPGEDAQLERRR